MSKRSRERVVVALGALPAVAVLAWIGIWQGLLMLLAFLGGFALSIVAVTAWLLLMARVERWAERGER